MLKTISFGAETEKERSLMDDLVSGMVSKCLSADRKLRGQKCKKEPYCSILSMSEVEFYIQFKSNER